MRLRTLNTIASLRKACMDVVIVADAVLHDRYDPQKLAHHIRVVQMQAQKTLLALEDLE